MKRRKPKGQRKEYQKAATHSGQGVATWLRAVGLREAAKLLD